MKTFDGYINRELSTIQEFTGTTKTTTKLRKIFNEGYSTYDFTFESGNTICITEVKTRNCHSYTYPDTVLELFKVNNMFKVVCDLSNKYDKVFKPIFLVKFIDGLYMIDMEKAKTTMSIKSCPKHSANDGDNNFTNKALVHYTLNNAVKLN